MFTAIDHLVIVVPELEASIREYTAAGFTVVRGGRHNIGTHNALIAFEDDSYLELISFLNPVAGHPWYAALEKGGGIVDFCVQTDNLQADAEAMRAAGVAVGLSAPMTRVRPDGYRLSWVLAIPQPPFNGLVPFLINDETPRAERLPRERSHRNGVTGIRRLTIAVEDPYATSAPYIHVLGGSAAPVQSSELHGTGVKLMIGACEVDLIAPDAAEGPLVDWIKARGQSPYAAALAGPVGGRLDAALLGHVRLSIG
jgi:catechol 2,3-dioxygenase-like lactoylglutathione lyase family enzyme